MQIEAWKSLATPSCLLKYQREPRSNIRIEDSHRASLIKDRRLRGRDTVHKSQALLDGCMAQLSPSPNNELGLDFDTFHTSLSPTPSPAGSPTKVKLQTPLYQKNRTGRPALSFTRYLKSLDVSNIYNDYSCGSNETPLRDWDTWWTLVLYSLYRTTE